MNCLDRLALKIAYRIQLFLWWCLRPERPSAHVALLCGDQVLVVRNSYRPRIGLPAGQAHSGESLERGALRELLEEVGITLEPKDIRMVGVAPNREEYKLDQAHLFEAVLSQKITPSIDGREVIWAGYMSREALAGADLTYPLRKWLQSELIAIEQRPTPNSDERVDQG
jgi:ADP-ribose pyrophosphatase YjhB (NUDIX family)